jgi:hypothetical protein
MFRPANCAILAGLLLVAGCDMLGVESATAVAARREAEGKAIGGACRHAGRAIEDCYQLNRKADKAAVFAGWREMNDYMRENKIEEVPPQLTPPTAAASAADSEATVSAPVKKAGRAHGDKPDSKKQEAS